MQGFIHFLARSEKTNQKRGATPKAPFKGGCKQRVAEADDSLWVLVSRDDAIYYFNRYAVRKVDAVVLGDVVDGLRG